MLTATTMHAAAMPMSSKLLTGKPAGMSSEIRLSELKMENSLCATPAKIAELQI